MIQAIKTAEDSVNGAASTAKAKQAKCQTKALAPSPFGYARDFLKNRFVYLTISPRARGLSIGLNLNPDAACSFNCLYCEVDRTTPRLDAQYDFEVAGAELVQTLDLLQQGGLRKFPVYDSLPAEFLHLGHVALSGDGEPTASPHFLQTIETVTHIRASGGRDFFKIVVITNAAHLQNPEVKLGLNLLTPRDEIWAKLDAGTQKYLELVNGATIPVEQITANILGIASHRPVIIQSLFSQIDGAAPTDAEITAYTTRLRELKNAGANIPLVQIYSATRPISTDRVGHLPLRVMSDIAARVRRETGLRAEVF